MKPITPVPHIDTTVSVPGSKSLTQRALIASALASGDSQLLGPLASEDTRYTIAALAAMGLLVDTSDPDCWRVAGTGGRIETPATPGQRPQVNTFWPRAVPLPSNWGIWL